MSSRSTSSVPPGVNSPAACSPPVLAKTRWASRKRSGSGASTPGETRTASRGSVIARGDPDRLNAFLPADPAGAGGEEVALRTAGAAPGGPLHVLGQGERGRLGCYVGDVLVAHADLPEADPRAEAAPHRTGSRGQVDIVAGRAHGYGQRLSRPPGSPAAPRPRAGLPGARTTRAVKSAVPAAVRSWSPCLDASQCWPGGTTPGTPRCAVLARGTRHPATPAAPCWPGPLHRPPDMGGRTGRADLAGPFCLVGSRWLFHHCGAPPRCAVRCRGPGRCLCLRPWWCKRARTRGLPRAAAYLGRCRRPRLPRCCLGPG